MRWINFPTKFLLENEMTLSGFLCDSEGSTPQYWNSVVLRIRVNFRENSPNSREFQYRSHATHRSSGVNSRILMRGTLGTPPRLGRRLPVYYQNIQAHGRTPPHKWGIGGCVSTRRPTVSKNIVVTGGPYGCRCGKRSGSSGFGQPPKGRPHTLASNKSQIASRDAFA